MSSPLFSTSAFVSTVLLHADRSGIAAGELRRRAGIGQELLADQGAHLPAMQLQKLWAECELASGDPRFGCEMAGNIGTHFTQGLNILADSAPTLGDSLRCISTYLPLLTNCLGLRLVEDGEQVILEVLPALPDQHHFGLDVALLRLVHGNARRTGLAPCELFSEAHTRPNQRCAEQLAALGIPTGHGANPCLVMPRALLQRPLASANEFLHQSLRQVWQRALDGRRRHDGENLQLARLWLKSSGDSVERIAERVGYRQPGNFIRAFRKEFGITPKQFRLSHC
ncbi:hypothetical protein D3C78_578060 [compost metagenome]